MVRSINRPIHPTLDPARRRQSLDAHNQDGDELRYMPQFPGGLEYNHLGQRSGGSEYFWGKIYLTTFVHLSLKQPIELRGVYSEAAIQRMRAGQCTFDLSNASEKAWHDTICKLEEQGADDVVLGMHEGGNDEKGTLIICEPAPSP